MIHPGLVFEPHLPLRGFPHRIAPVGWEQLRAPQDTFVLAERNTFYNTGQCRHASSLHIYIKACQARLGLGLTLTLTLNARKDGGEAQTGQVEAEGIIRPINR